MSRYSDWYAVELDGYLRGRMSEVQRFESTKEILNHFSEHVEDLVAKGMDPVDAEKAAIVAFGPPRQAAINLIGRVKENSIGKWLVWLGCLMIAWLTFGLGLFGLLFKIQAGLQSSFVRIFYDSIWHAVGVLVVSLAIGTILTRKVHVMKMLLAGGVGIAGIAGFFLVGPELNYGNVPKDKFEAMATKWKTANQTTNELAKLELSVAQATHAERYDGNKFVLNNADQAIERIKTDMPKMVALNSEFVKVSGTRTAGYLGPPPTDYSRNFIGEDRDGINPRTFAKSTGEFFPIATRTFQYYETPEEALKAWRDSQRIYGSAYSVFNYAAREQAEFIAGAERFGMLSGPQLLVASILPVILIVGAYLAAMMLIAWPLTKLPNLTFRTSFRRRFA